MVESKIPLPSPNLSLQEKDPELYEIIQNEKNR